MVSVNAGWWEHLVPKGMYKRIREVERLLNKWCATPEGTEWLNSATKPNGVIRVRPGQALPVVHLIVLGDRPMFMAPFERVREGHRTVGGGDFGSGDGLARDELAIQPMIMVDLVSDPAMLAAAARLQLDGTVSGVQQPSLVFSVPAHLLLAPTAWPKNSYVLYQHIFGGGDSYPNDGLFYVGVTTRTWQARWSEHRRAMETGSPLQFHRRMREEIEAGRVTYVHHKVMGVTRDLEALYESEEFLVRGHWEDKRRLNMIPGGKSGLAYLREHRMLGRGVVPPPDERDRLVEQWMLENPRRGVPAPWVSEKWKDEDWAVAQICGREDRLSVAQVHAIRQLADSHNAEEIAERIGARNADQVRRVLAGKTYVRVRS